MGLGRVGVAAAPGSAAVGVAKDDAALLDEAEVEDLAGQLVMTALERLEAGCR